MICILKIENGEVRSWIIATDVPDARRQAYNVGESDLARELYRMEFTPIPGKHALQSGWTMLVS